jgi:hypothetical protein
MHTLQILAFHAYQIADAMIEASAITASILPPEPQATATRPQADSGSLSDVESPY